MVPLRCLKRAEPFIADHNMAKVVSIDREYELVRRRVRLIADRWVKPIGLGWWTVHLCFARHPSDMPRTGNPEAQDPRETCVMSTHVTWQYREATITVNAEAAHEADDDALEKYFVHELVHIFLNEMREIAKDDGFADHWIDHEESVCTALAQALVWARAAGFADGKRGHGVQDALRRLRHAATKRGPAARHARRGRR